MTWKGIVVLGVVLFSAQVSAEETPVLNTMKEKVSYAIGVDMARNIQRQGIEVDRDLLLKGVKDGVSGEKLLMSDDEFHKTMKVVLVGQKRKEMEIRQKQAERKRKQAGARE